MSYKQFMAQLSDDIEPDAAKERYERYKQDYYMSRRDEYFHTVKHEPDVREQYHPVCVEKMIKRRAERAVRAAASFSAEYKAGTLVTDTVERKPSDDGNRGSGGGGEGGSGEATTAAEKTGGGDAGDDGMAMLDDEEDKEGYEERKRQAGIGNRDGDNDDKLSEDFEQRVTPRMAWSSERVAKDVVLSARLVRLLDREKGIEENPLQAILPSEGDVQTTEATNGNGDHAGMGDKGLGDKDMTSGADDTAGGASGGGIASQSALRDLDLLLEWLWRVHRIDYYDCFESLDDSEVRMRNCSAVSCAHIADKQQHERERMPAARTGRKSTG